MPRLILCSRLADAGFHMMWAHTEDVRQGRIEPEALLGDDLPDLLLYDIDHPVDESLLLLTLFRLAAGPPLGTPGVVAVLTRPCEPTLARSIIATALRDRHDEAA